jgi:hypothetical protein
LSEKQVNIMEKVQKIGDQFNQYKDQMVATFKDMEVDVKDWNFAVAKADKEYNVEFTVKLNIKPKKK